MTVRVLLFAQLAETIGQRELSVEADECATAGDVLEILARREAAIERLRDRIALAVDQRYARPEHRLRDGQTLALIPPVSGG